jgi:NADH:ubiquinone oxidoreductase subunit B-like Fe-S oxidoreductase
LPPRPETLIEGVMAIQKIVERDGIKDSQQRAADIDWPLNRPVL